MLFVIGLVVGILAGGAASYLYAQKVIAKATAAGAAVKQADSDLKKAL